MNLTRCLVVVFGIICLVASGGGGGGGDDPAPIDNGTTPVIDNIVLAKNTASGYVETNSFIIGDMANVAIYCHDPDFDMRYLHLSKYENDVIVFGPEVLELPSQGTTVDKIYYLLEDERVDFAGNFKYEVQIEDAKENITEPFVFFIVVTE